MKTSARKREGEAEHIALRETDTQIIIGKDILELLSSAMYVDPLTIYREYVQNSADAIDVARTDNKTEYRGRIQIFVDGVFRTIRIRDNGAGVQRAEFVKRLTSIGASGKRGSAARGFRGVGRLAGLGYCRELGFRSRGATDKGGSELVWDCRALRTLIRGSENIELADLVKQVVSVRSLSVDDTPGSFFEVELRGVVRLKNDQLVNPAAVTDYLAQVAPVPFHPEFSFRDSINSLMSSHIQLHPVEITINDNEPIFRPHRNTIETSAGSIDSFSDFEPIVVKAVDGRTAAVGWILHHGYVGALPTTSKFKGLRLRCGDIQVGEANLLEELFSEARFNAWSVGEIHILDNRITPNGRRDHFEQNSHFVNFIVQMAPVAREISRRCRQSSIERKWLRDFETHERLVFEKSSIIAQRGVPKETRRELTAEAKSSLAKMEKLAGGDSFVFIDRSELQGRFQTAATRLKQSRDAKADLDPLRPLPERKKKFLRELVRLVYQCSVNRVAARSLIERIFVQEGLPPPAELDSDNLVITET